MAAVEDAKLVRRSAMTPGQAGAVCQVNVRLTAIAGAGLHTLGGLDPAGQHTRLRARTAWSRRGEPAHQRPPVRRLARRGTVELPVDTRQGALANRLGDIGIGSVYLNFAENRT